MKKLLFFVLGFIAYPLVFVPLLAHFAPQWLLDGWIEAYANYLRALGV